LAPFPSDRAQTIIKEMLKAVAFIKQRQQEEDISKLEGTPGPKLIEKETINFLNRSIESALFDQPIIP